jgi:hypothetical protein
MGLCPSAVPIVPRDRSPIAIITAAMNTTVASQKTGLLTRIGALSYPLCAIHAPLFFGWQDCSTTRIERFRNPMTEFEKTSQMTSKKR